MVLFWVLKKKMKKSRKWRPANEPDGLSMGEFVDPVDTVARVSRIKNNANIAIGVKKICVQSMHLSVR